MKKRRLIITDFEKGLLINALMQFRNNALATGKPAEDITELILRVIDAPKKNGGDNITEKYIGLCATASEKPQCIFTLKNKNDACSLIFLNRTIEKRKLI